MDDETISIILCGRPTLRVLRSDDFKYAEDLCKYAAQNCNIGCSARHLFCLFNSANQTWVSPCEEVLQSSHNEYEFRLRFKLPDVSRLLEIDKNAFDYYFLQIRQDFLNGKIPEIASLKENALGLAVADMLREKLETGRSTEIVENDYKNFLPQEVTKQYKYILSRFLKKAMRNTLAKIEQNKNPSYVKEQYIKRVLEIKPSYGCEEYTALVDEGGRVIEVRLKLDPFHPNLPGLQKQIGSKKSPWSHICSIEELCYISMRNDGTVEISRRNGIPQYFKFQSIAKMKSFVSLLDGYYRLTEKWTFNLCKDLPVPSLLYLKTLKCHGPVGKEFAHKKLLEKGDNQAGAFIIREHSFNEFHLDVLIDEKKVPQTFFIQMDDDNHYHLSEHSERFPSLQELLNYLIKELTLKLCIPPSEYDKSPLLLCRVENKDYSSVIAKQARLAPVCINKNSLTLLVNKKGLHGRKCHIRQAIWQRGPSERYECALKCMNNGNDTQEFLQMINKCIFWHDESLVTMYGFVISPPMLVMEYLPLGPLDEYLQTHRHELQEVDLVEAATYLARALWLLEEQNLCHGNIRCRNILVSYHGENCFKVKLADTGLPHLDSFQIHWIPPECFNETELVMKSLAADVWAFGTTLWEIFSYGATPLEGVTVQEARSLYLKGTRLSKPHRCHDDIYKLMLECWIKDPDSRKQPQAIMRDINQIIYEVFNSRRTHAYATISTRQPSFDASNGSSDSLSNKTTLPATPRGLQRKFGCNNVDNCAEDQSSNENNDSDSAKWSSSSAAGESGSPRINDFLIGFTEDLRRPINNLPFSPSDTSLMSLSHDQEWVIEMNQLEMLQRLGQGFYGEVKKARLSRWSGLENEEVAVKQLRKSCMSTGLQDLLREISIMKALQHKNIVEIKGVVEDPEMLLVMEYVPLGSLLVYLRTYKNRLSEQELLKFAADVAEGMEYLGQKRIVHRDLAARNILVASRDSVKISDFGLAQMMGPKDYYRLKTNRDLPIRWYAPETISQWCFTHKSDVWSYGVTLWEMFSFGEEPILEGCKDEDLLETLESGKRLSCPSNCSIHIYSYLMKRCWEANPDARPNFTELLAEIQAMQK